MYACLKLISGLLILALSACADPPPDPEALAKAAAIPDRALFGVTPCEQLEPQQTATSGAAPTSSDGELSAALRSSYQRSCAICHENPAAGAPLTGDRQQWAPRLKQGQATLLSHTVNGYQKMPPLGLCMECSEADFVALINYMSRPQP